MLVIPTKLSVFDCWGNFLEEIPVNLTFDYSASYGMPDDFGDKLNDLVNNSRRRIKSHFSILNKREILEHLSDENSANIGDFCFQLPNGQDITDTMYSAHTPYFPQPKPKAFTPLHSEEFI